ncbi:MAG: hydroxyacid dehydrogenase [Actinomycetota bacterium]|nr:hydroxyacid dehydrogenase [Actinomycetota bacterium]
MKILVCDQLQEVVLNQLLELGEITDISGSSNKNEELSSHIVDAEVVVIRSATTLTKEILAHAKNVKIIARCGVGIDNVDVEYAKSRDIYVTNAPTANLISLVEHTIGLILSTTRKIYEANASTKSGKWEKSKFVGLELHQKQLGIIGFGKAGKLLSERLKSFGMKIVFYDPFVTDWEGEEESVALEYLLSSSDVVSVHVIKTPQTENLLSKEKLNLLKPNAILVNTSRGGIIDEEYLVELVNSNKIFGAALDVFDKEPIEENNKILDSDILITPHIGASTIEAQLKAGLDTVQNIKKILEGDTSPAL